MKILMVVYDNDSYITWFPQGLAYLASAARNTGHEVSVYQQDIYHWPDEHLTKYLDEHEFDVVEVSVIGGYYQYHKLLSLSKAINASKNRKHFKYTIGGHGPASDPEYFMRKTDADVVGIGEGEITFVEMLDAFAGKRTLESVDGIAFFDKDGNYVKTKPRELIQNIDEIAWPAYDLFDMTYYSLLRLPNIKPNERCMPMLSGRGCIFACNFCYRLDKGFRPRSAESIIKEIEFLRDTYNIKYIAFSDELLMSSRERTLELCQAFIDAKINVKWDCNGRLNFADIDVLEKMKEAGCVFINYGIESLDNATLRVMHKGLTKDMIIRGVENTLKVGISPGLNIIYGNINEPLGAIDDAVDFLLKYDDHAQMRTIRPVTPYPGTELFEYAIEKGLVKDTADFYENKHTNSDLIAVNFTQYTDEEVYEALYQANMRLIHRYQELQMENSTRICDDLYHNKNADFRGFRQS
ncbi:MAG: radical SAM protein [bacterium]|nr:radical SAM protein [bacterium]MDY4099817.1 radical SAM protein [Lachnospiraceae bacterium]